MTYAEKVICCNYIDASHGWLQTLKYHIQCFILFFSLSPTIPSQLRGSLSKRAATRT